MKQKRLDIILLGFGIGSLAVGIIDTNKFSALTGIIALCSAAIVNAIYSTNKS